ncbi:hypothetical protein BGZ61DRAFT_477561 [Ilyonectria robusta]|uniref:uncharacterized protein n=1 Tax=Ilyonectria robusta TaxID=1079257 RepID=UPI001E8DB969|nr:uncharacterized protein BGZ61DRAFT_477561 [Ilyonectria robusta]KAH8699568.1 hypothetical protein BGZ61DRAFT_477561 [Ilyonectria robusta]
MSVGCPCVPDHSISGAGSVSVSRRDLHQVGKSIDGAICAPSTKYDGPSGEPDQSSIPSFVSSHPQPNQESSTSHPPPATISHCYCSLRHLFRVSATLAGDCDCKHGFDFPQSTPQTTSWKLAPTGSLVPAFTTVMISTQPLASSQLAEARPGARRGEEGQLGEKQFLLG